MKGLYAMVLVGGVMLAVTAARAADTVTYYYNDAQGSPVAVADASGAIVESTEYAPYGQTLNRPVHDGPGYTGHEEDSATGFTYMQQRYYDSQSGQFISTDPMLPDGNTGASFNRYEYAADNPYRNIDPDGRWPTDIHEKIIDKAFPGLSAAQRQTLRSSSSMMDSVTKGGQDVKNSYQHSMKSPTESVGTAKQETQSFIHGQESVAREEQGKTPTSVSGLKVDSLAAVGKAIHTATDGTSPAHTDSNGNPKTWTGLMHPVDTMEHVRAESSISPAQMDNAVNAARSAFSAAYGNDLEMQAAEPNGH